MSGADERIRRSWDENADVWTDAVRAGAIASRRLATDEAVVAAVRACNGIRVLDVGCGEGWLARRLAAAGYDVTGVDASAALIERARQHGGGARYVCISYDEIAEEPARAGTDYHVAVCNFSLLAESTAPLLRALRGIVTPPACLVVQTVHPATLALPPAEDGWMEESFAGLPGSWTSMPWYYRTFASWAAVLDETGWQLARHAEPLHPATELPLSLLMTATARSHEP